MRFDLARLRRGEVIVGASGLVLLASLFLLKWFGLSGALLRLAKGFGTSSSVTGWNSLSHVRWLTLVTIIVALLLVVFQAGKRSPAVPVSLSVITFVLALVNALALIYRVLISLPGPDSAFHRKLGAWIGLVAALALVAGGYLSIRQEGVLERDGPGEVPTVDPLSAAGS